GMQERLARLEQLAMGLARGVVLWRQANDPLLYLERKAYLNGVQDAIAGLEDARVTLAKALPRAQGEKGPLGGSRQWTGFSGGLLRGQGPGPQVRVGWVADTVLGVS